MADVVLPAGQYLLHGKVNVISLSLHDVLVMCAITTSVPGTMTLHDQSHLKLDAASDSGGTYPSRIRSCKRRWW
jgi:hypothetical protein